MGLFLARKAMWALWNFFNRFIFIAGPTSRPGHWALAWARSSSTKSLKPQARAGWLFLHFSSAIVWKPELNSVGLRSRANRICPSSGFTSSVHQSNLSMGRKKAKKEITKIKIGGVLLFFLYNYVFKKSLNSSFN